jgi:hypothetical protein
MPKRLVATPTRRYDKLEALLTNSLPFSTFLP